MKYGVFIFFLSVLGGCQPYEIAYVGQTQITEQKIKLPDVGPPGQYDKVVENNTAFQFTLENMEIENLIGTGKSYRNDFTWLEAFICGEKKFETTLASALYFSEELKFVDGAPKSETEKSFYGVFIPRLMADMRENAKKQDKPICIRVSQFTPWELKRTSNTIKLRRFD